MLFRFIIIHYFSFLRRNICVCSHHAHIYVRRRRQYKNIKIQFIFMEVSSSTRKSQTTYIFPWGEKKNGTFFLSFWHARAHTHTHNTYEPSLFTSDILASSKRRISDSFHFALLRFNSRKTFSSSSSFASFVFNFRLSATQTEIIAYIYIHTHTPCNVYVCIHITTNVKNKTLKYNKNNVFDTRNVYTYIYIKPIPSVKLTPSQIEYQKICFIYESYIL